ncbi:hypothetical protein [Nostoc sp. NMS4]|uniref:hypothetical protein n=1 Tax=Nostoc sp. NMS4 TaxID=2815390 RepID=UPI0025ECACE8|nr:hypothetical protein [Nostoc sp. NMS4]MBN3927960.1 hypothetical protein [Nostoc sp. NMS4]
MEFAAIALGIGIDAAFSRRAMPTKGYTYAAEICSIKTPKNQLHLTQLIEF